MSLAKDSLLTVRQLADYLRIDPSTIYRLVAAGRLPAFRFGRSWRFHPGAIDKWEVDQTAASSAHPAEKGSSPKPRSVGAAVLAAIATMAVFASSAAAGRPKSGGVGLVPCGDGNLIWTPTTLWPPNHKFQTIKITFGEGTPTNDDTLGFRITGISSNQQIDDDEGGHGCGKPTSKQGPDFEFSTDLIEGPPDDDSVTLATTVKVRAERCARDGARVYTIDVTCEDEGSTDDATLTVTVPKSRGRRR